MFFARSLACEPANANAPDSPYLFATPSICYLLRPAERCCAVMFLIPLLLQLLLRRRSAARPPARPCASLPTRRGGGAAAGTSTTYWQCSYLSFHCCCSAANVVDVVFEYRRPPFRISVRLDADELVDARAAPRRTDRLHGYLLNCPSSACLFAYYSPSRLPACLPAPKHSRETESASWPSG